MDREGLLYVIQEGREDQKDHPSIFVFDQAGKFVRAFGNQFQGGGHGIEIRQEGNQEFLYVCAYQMKKTFAKMDMADFRAVIDVHLVGTAVCTKAVWEIMRAQAYGRIIATSSPSGLYGIFGQANYGAAKAGMIGFMNALHLEGGKYNIRFNLLSPSAKTRMTEDIGIPEALLETMTPKSITAGLLYLVSEEAPSRAILSCAAGGYARAYVAETDGVYLPPAEQTPENIAAMWETISDINTVRYYETSAGPNMNFLAKAQAYAEKK